MLIKLLSDTDKRHLLDLAKLLSIADKPLLWDGKSADELTSGTNLDALTIQEGEQECELIAELEKSVGVSSEQMAFGNLFGRARDVKARLIEALKTYPVPKADKPETRVQAATSVLKEVLKSKTFELPTAPKVILFELLLVSLRDGHISSIEWALLKEFQQHHRLEDFIFDDLLERAETLNQEVSKTISIILE
ncbi:hypothetical protein QF043_001622 [Pseudomonas sp. W3I7]|jgi:hypothetical protein|uniref:hypothetical protein n=1 Tax=Pseudomonas sp. W3I7 TaxID=3042292 RepID=UPI0027917333|nr:hypothetical protein [Pseudomonas sp. W3I7]MDQ0702830.1 hypothetical protein [Pseudomonas sp. W3I7]